jgi:cytochrome oxidase Cu insertion factor (SCO1/SenC/PrrC family)
MNRVALHILAGKIVVLLLLLTVTAFAQSAPGAETLSPSDLNRVKVGTTAPDFTLENQDGKAVTLSEFRGKKTVVLVFYRGYW